jgi:magnesium transporter
MSARIHAEHEHDDRDLAAKIAGSAAHEAIAMIAGERDETIAQTLEGMNPSDAVRILWELRDERRARVLEKASPEWACQWTVNQRFPEDAIGRLMAPSFAEFPPEMTVREATDELRQIVKRAFVSYAYVIDRERKLLGVLVFREMMFADPTQALSDVMIQNPFRLTGATPVMDAMREVLKWHHPSYPVCDDAGRLVGVIRGQTLFEQQAFELSAQPGSMVGIQKEERLATPWPRSLRFRHPWLQLNLLTAFLAASIVGVFQGTINRIVILAVFLPVLAGQSGNTGCQAMAVTLRGMTLGELRQGKARAVILKEAWLGFLNGALVGVTAGFVMLVYATAEHLSSAWTLGAVVAISMTIACTASGVSGVVVPMALRRMGADPVTASSIFLTTATDCASMGIFLGLATLLIR